MTSHKRPTIILTKSDFKKLKNELQQNLKLMRPFRLRQTPKRLTMTISVLKEFSESRTSFSQTLASITKQKTLMKKFLFLLLALCSFTVFSQQRESENLIRVSGLARIAVSPKVGIMNVEVETIDTTMETSIAKLRIETNELFKILKSLNFEIEKVSTTDFSVNKNTIRNHNVTKDSGFVASQVIRAEFSFNDTIMDMILTEIAEKSSGLEFNFDFKLSEIQKKEIQSELIKLAVEDAKQKAESLAEHTGKTIKKIKEIQFDYTPRYSSEKSGMIEVYNGYNRHSSSSGLFARQRENFNFKPADLIFQDSVVIFFEIK
jgi:uncharacterized protein YggE